MVRPGHCYRKRCDHQSEAEQTASGLARFGNNIDKLGPTKVWVEEDNGVFYVYVELAGEMDPAEVLAATGFERLSC